MRTQVNELWRSIDPVKTAADAEHERFPAEPQENILYFVETN